MCYDLCYGGGGVYNSSTRNRCTNQENSSPNKTVASWTHCSNWPNRSNNCHIVHTASSPAQLDLRWQHQVCNFLTHSHQPARSMFHTNTCPNSPSYTHLFVHPPPPPNNTNHSTHITTTQNLTVYLSFQCWTSYAVIYYIVLLMMGILMPETCWAKHWIKLLLCCIAPKNYTVSYNGMYVRKMYHS
jgi:hypothetical protein